MRAGFSTVRLSIGLVVAAAIGAMANRGGVIATPRLISYNIRMQTYWPVEGEAMWEERLPHLIAQLESETAGHADTLMCLQEVTAYQLENIRDTMGNEKWSYIGVGRDDGKCQGEYNPILYQSEAWRLVGNDTYWLAETPRKTGVKGWDAWLPRVVTVGEFEHVASGLPLVYMCTHFDHHGQRAREGSARLLTSIGEQYARGESFFNDNEDDDDKYEPVPVFLGGDLNVEPQNLAYRRMLYPGAWRDVKREIKGDRVQGHQKTYTGFTDNVTDDLLIDYVFAWDMGVRGMNVTAHRVEDNRFEDGIWISDHRPIIVDLWFPAKESN